MAEPKVPSVTETTGTGEAKRERELREMVQRAEHAKSGDGQPEKESPHDFVERKMREKPEK
jgi:hypothetical protein